MRVICNPEPGVIQLNFMWLPTFLGMNTIFKKEIEAKIAPKLVGKPMTDEVLDAAHEEIIGLILEKYPLPGLSDYLDALKFIDG